MTHNATGCNRNEPIWGEIVQGNFSGDSYGEMLGCLWGNLPEVLLEENVRGRCLGVSREMPRGGGVPGNIHGLVNRQTHS